MTLPGQIAELLRRARAIAVVGCSPKPHRDSHGVARYLQEHGYKVIPVYPGVEEILGVRAYPDLRSAAAAEGPIDIVDIFRRPELVGPHADEAIEVGARLIWMQLGVVNEDAAAKARAAGIPVVMDRCIRVEHAALKK
ncbi:MAG: CoA-binding protein [Gemmatimonadetes bacterium]|nr:CoA-binding protein [Gemmatimonadota bacterium]